MPYPFRSRWVGGIEELLECRLFAPVRLANPAREAFLAFVLEADDAALTDAQCEDGDEIGVRGFPLGGQMDKLLQDGAVPFTSTFSQGIVSAALP